MFIIVVSFPLLPSALASTRLLRLTRLTRVLRLLRLTRLAAVLSRGASATGVVFRKRGLGYVAVITLIVALGLGGVFAIFETSSIGDGLWWAIVTVTTVGYGDIYPATTGGRVAASVLIFAGIGLVAFLTAAVAAHFVGEEEAEATDDIERLHQRLDRIEAALGIESHHSGHDQGESAGW